MTPEPALPSRFEATGFFDAKGQVMEAAAPFKDLVVRSRPDKAAAAAGGLGGVAGTLAGPVRASDKARRRWPVQNGPGLIELEAPHAATTVHVGPARTREGEGPDFGQRLEVATLGTYYDCWGGGTDDARVRSVETYQNAATARMGGFVRVENHDPDGNDDIWGHAESGFCWWHTPSRDCRLQLTAVVVQTYARSRRDLFDQWGAVSNCRVWQDNFLTAGFFYDLPHSYGKTTTSVGPGSYYSGDGGQSQDNDGGGPYDTTGTAVGYPDVDSLSREDGPTRFMTLPLDAPVFRDRPVLCFIGARSQFFAHLDDVTADVWQGGTWKVLDLFIKEV